MVIAKILNVHDAHTEHFVLSISNDHKLNHKMNFEKWNFNMWIKFGLYLIWIGGLLAKFRGNYATYVVKKGEETTSVEII